MTLEHIGWVEATKPGPIFCTYENNGNLLSDGSRTFSYDSANRLTSVLDNGVISQYAYNGDGDRLSQTVGGVTTGYVFDPVGLTQVLAETTAGQSTFYVPGLAQYGVTGWQYFGQDRLGSVRTLMNPTGEVLLARNYDPFGNVIIQGGSGQSRFGFTGEEVDATGLVYLRARYYQPATGRFLTPDPIIPDPTSSQSWNRYLYTENNPVRYADPSGYCPPSICQDENGIPLDPYYQDSYQEWFKVDEYDALTYQEYLKGRRQTALYQADPHLYLAHLEAQWSDEEIDELMGCSTIYAEYALNKHLEHLVLGATDISLASEIFEPGSVIDTLKDSAGPFAAGILGFFKKPSGKNIKYTSKVLRQMQLDDFHGFPKEVDNYIDSTNAIVYTIKGGDGVIRTVVDIPGKYKGREGVFRYIFEPDNVTVNHRMFHPD